MSDPSASLRAFGSVTEMMDCYQPEQHGHEVEPDTKRER